VAVTDRPTVHVHVLAPMVLELDAVVLAFGLDPGDEPGTFRGRHGSVQVTASGTGIGPELAETVTEALLAVGRPDHVMVAGIAGGLDPALEVGSFVNPEVVIDARDGSRHEHHPVVDRPRSGGLVTTPILTTDPDVVRGFVELGGVAVDMETAAVAAVCERHGVAWSAYRVISDRPSDGLLDDSIIEMTNPDGSADLDVVARRLAEDPELAARLERLARDSTRAARLAADVALEACRRLAN